MAAERVSVSAALNSAFTRSDPPGACTAPLAFALPLFEPSQISQTMQPWRWPGASTSLAAAHSSGAPLVRESPSKKVSMKELSKSIARRLSDSNFIRRYFVGRGIDIGGAPDPLALYSEFFPLMESVKIWDLDDGDAQFMNGVADGHFDFVASSHCLEHLNDPAEGLRNWLRIVKEGGYLVILVPDEDLYEQGKFPSTFNRDHKWTFTVHKAGGSWSDRSLNLFDLLRDLGPAARVEKIELLTASYRFNLPRYDQTVTPVGEAAIEIVIRKAPADEVQTGRRLQSSEQPDRVMRRYYNQYRLDQETIKRGNPTSPPFTDERDL